MIRSTERTNSAISTSPGVELSAVSAESRPSSKYRATGLGITSTSPRKTSPVVPSIEMTSPSLTTSPLAVVICRATVSTSSESAPHTAVFPMPRATTAACEVFPPRLVSTPAAATMPPRSSGLVSRRTRITCSPASERSTAARESNTTLPTAAPGEAFIPRAMGADSDDTSNVGNINCANWCPLTRRSASSMSMMPSSTNCTAIRKAAPAVRLPTRVCSIHRWPISTVNSMSHKSR